MLDLPVRPTAIAELQAASAIGQGRLYRSYDELLRERGRADRAGAADVLRHERPRRTTSTRAARWRRCCAWRVVPVINENDTTTTDEISFGDNDFLAAQVAVLLRRRPARAARPTPRASSPPTRARIPQRELIEQIDRLRAALESADIASTRSALGSGGMRSKVVAAEMATAAGTPTVICIGLRRRRAAGGGCRRARRHALPRALARALELQAVAEVRQADPRDDHRRRGRRARPARGRHDPAAGRHRRRQRQLRRRRRGRGRRRRPPHRQGDRQLLGLRAEAREGHEVRRGARADAKRHRGSGPPRLLRAVTRP